MVAGTIHNPERLETGAVGVHLQITGTHGERDHKQITSAGTSHRKIHPREPVMKDGTLNQMGIATWLGAVAAVSAATIGVTPARVVLQAGSKAEVEQTATGAIITLADRLMMAVAAGVEVARPKKPSSVRPVLGTYAISLCLPTTM